MLRITAIDDDESNLRLVEAVLSPEYDVTAYDRPRAALDALRKGTAPDLIVCDVTMPGLDGFQLHEELRKIPALRAVPFLFLTALADRANVRRGMGQGADDYVTKPFTPSDLREAVESRLARTHGLREAVASGLAITSLGGLEIAAGGKRLQWEAKRVVELLLLLVSRGGSVDIDEVRRELWSEQPSANYLHVLLSRLRKTVEGVARVELEDDIVSLDVDVDVTWDAAVFEDAGRRALQAGDDVQVERAIAMYGGAFLAGFDSPWAERQRLGFEERFVALLEVAVDLASSESAEARAQARLERFLGFDEDDPFGEDDGIPADAGRRPSARHLVAADAVARDEDDALEGDAVA